MPRYYKYKRYYKKVYPKKRWASNIFTRNTLVTLGNGAKVASETETLCLNSAQNANPTPVIVKFGRVKVKGDIRTDVASNNNYVSGIMYVVFCPQGMSVDEFLIDNHPEYILGWTQISLDSGNGFSFSSSLKRNLNSGDKIGILFQVNSVNAVQAVRNFNFYYTVQFWTTSA
ncbi:putative capsid protein [Porcine serum associated circular DNA virus 3]|nr:putative capsid protein [Porcine serum associated circular DNA virus 3]